MTHEQFLAEMLEGLDEAAAASVRTALSRDNVKNKVTGWKQQSEYQDILTKANEVEELKAQLDAVGPDGVPKGYRAWYKKYSDAVMQNSKAIQDFEKKYGAGSLQKYIEGTVEGGTPGVKLEDVDKRLQEQNSTLLTRVASTIKGAGTIVNRHMRNGRKNDIDWDAIDKWMGDHPGVSLTDAYDAWDKPEAEKVAEAAREAEIKKRVDEEVAKVRSTQNLPANIDPQGPGTLVARTKDDKFDRSSLIQDMTKTWNDAGRAA